LKYATRSFASVMEALPLPVILPVTREAA
jgi:hypothetical protein